MKTNAFFGNTSQTLKLCKNTFLILELTINVYWSLPKGWSKSFKWLNIDARLKITWFCQRIQNQFLEKARQILKLCKNFFQISEVTRNIFWSLPKANRILWLKFVWRIQYKNSSQVGIKHKFVMKSAKCLNRIFWVLEFRYNAPKYQD